MFSPKDIIRECLLTAEPKSWPTFDGGFLKRHENVTASEAGDCVRKLAFAKTKERGTTPIPDYWQNMDPFEFQARLDAMPDDDKLGTFERGHNVEAWVVERLNEMFDGSDEHMICTGDNQRSFYLVKGRVSGTPDGIYVNHLERTWAALEVKSSDNRMSSPRANHVNQLLVNMGIINSLARAGLLEHNVAEAIQNYTMIGGVLLYVNPSNYLTMDEFQIPWDNGEALSLAKVKAGQLFIIDKDSKKITGITPPESLPPEGLEVWGGCTFCPFKAECYDIEERAKHAKTSAKLLELLGRAPTKSLVMPSFKADASREQVLRVIADYDAYNKAEKDAKAHKDGLRDAIIEWVKTQEDMSAKFEDNGRLFKVSFNCSERTGSINTEALEAFLSAHDQSLDNFRKGPSKVETLLVSVKPV